MALKKKRWQRLRNIWPKRNARTKKSTFDVIRALKLEHSAKLLDETVTIILKLGTLFLVLVLVLFFLRIFKSEGYVMEPFNVPTKLEESGFDGYVVAQKIQDKVFSIKSFVGSIKADSVQLVGDEQPELDLKVLGVGVSLRTLVYQMRSLLAQKNQSIQGEITFIDHQYHLTLRMTGYAPVDHIEPVVEADHKAAIDRLITRAGELIIENTDPYRMAVMRYRQKRYEEAVDLVRKIIKEKPQEIHWAYLAWGSILEEQNQDFAAIRKFKRAIELKPDFSLAYYRIGLIAYGEKDYAEAIKYMSKAIKYDPQNQGRYQILGWVYHNDENYAAADSVFKLATKIDPNNPGPWSSWADSKISRGKPEEAIPLTRQAEINANEDAMGYLTRALGALARGDSTQAMEHVMTALDFEPTNEIAILAGINASWSTKNYPQVIAIFQNSDLSRMNPYQQQRLLNVVAMPYNYLGDNDKALAHINQAIEVDPDEGYPYSKLAEIYALSGDLESFYTELENAFKKGFRPDQIDLELEPYHSLREDPRLSELFDAYQEKFKN